MKEQLTIARRHVASAKRIVATQEQRLSRLQTRRSDTTQAFRLLVMYRESLRLTEADCARLEASAEGKNADGQ
jgi:hypothetical protein